jgi:hypothetical protein
MKYKLKTNKQSYYAVCDWAEKYDYNHQNEINKIFSDALGTTFTPIKKTTGFKRIDWNQWDKENGRIKDMYIEFTDLKLELIFLCSVANCIDNEEEDALY